MTKKHWFRRALAALGIATLAAGCGTAAAPAQRTASAPRPALWQVKDRDTTVYLFGTIHLLPKGYQWRTPKLDGAVARSNGLVVETIIDAKNPAGLMAVMAQLGVSPNLPPLSSRVPADKQAALQAAIARSGVPAAAFDRLETWAAAFTLIGTQFRSIGLHGDEGVETTLKQAFTAAGKPISQLETNAEQLGFFDTMPEDAQRALLVASLDQPEKVRDQFNDMLSAWARGDVGAIAKTFNDDMAGSSALSEALLRRRNANWARWIEGRMAQPGSVLVAVGAGHLAGNSSVQAMLQQRGLKVTRIQ